MPQHLVGQFKKIIANNREQLNAQFSEVKGVNDNLSTIAKHGTTADKIREINKLKSSTITPGQRLIIPLSAQTHLTKTTPVINGDDNPGPQLTEHIVTKGESISKVAKHHAIKPEQLIYWNQLSHNAKLKVGQELVVWKKASGQARPHYTVKYGDTLSEIAQSHHTTTKALMHINQLQSTIIHPGQVLFIPS